jgi:hypothetical protein
VGSGEGWGSWEADRGGKGRNLTHGTLTPGCVNGGDRGPPESPEPTRSPPAPHPLPRGERVGFNLLHAHDWARRARTRTRQVHWAYMHSGSWPDSDAGQREKSARYFRAIGEGLLTARRGNPYQSAARLDVSQWIGCVVGCV